MTGVVYSIEDLKYLMSRLRDPDGGCPWDLAQSYQTIAPSTIEEAYEVADAIERHEYTHLKEELGDLLFQVIFYSQLATEEERFDFDQIVSDLVAKLIRRHPHVFPENTLHSRVSGERSQAQEASIKQRWEQLKVQERAAKGQQGVLDDVPLNFPGLTRAMKLQKRASNVGFDWPDVRGALDKVHEELQEVEQAITTHDSQAVAEEIGDLLFSVVNVCRHLKVEPESAIRATNQKFEQRFNAIEAELEQRDMTVEEASAVLLDQLWEQAKHQLKAE